MNEIPSQVKKEDAQITSEKSPAKAIETPETTSEEMESLQEAILSEQTQLEAVQGEKGEESFLSQETKRKLKKAVLVLSLFAASFAATLENAEAGNHNNQVRHARDPYKRALEQGVTRSIRNVFNNTQRNILHADREQQRMEKERTNMYKQAFKEYNHDLHDAGNDSSAVNAAKQKYDERVKAIDQLIGSGRY